MGFYGDFHIARIDCLNQGPQTEELAPDHPRGRLSTALSGGQILAIVCPCPRISVHFGPSMSAQLR